MQLTHTQRGTQKKVEKGLLFFFDETFLSFPHFLPHFTSRNVRFNALLLLQKRVVVCLLSLLSFSFIATTARGVKIYIERDERGNLEPTREKRKKRSRGEFYFSSKALLLQNIFSSKPNHHRALERNER